MNLESILKNEIERPLSCSQWKNVTNVTSEHEAVFVKFNIKGIILKTQFRVSRNHRELNSLNISSKLAEAGGLENLLELEDAEENDKVWKGIFAPHH